MSLAEKIIEVTNKGYDVHFYSGFTESENIVYTRIMKEVDSELKCAGYGISMHALTSSDVDADTEFCVLMDHLLEKEFGENIEDPRTDAEIT